MAAPSGVVFNFKPMILQFNERLKRFSLNGIATTPPNGWVTISDSISDKQGSKFIIKSEKHYNFKLPNLDVIQFDFAKFIECQKTL